ncbi:ParA family protein, partial [Streptomyces sp. tea 10]|nr:ParA family protein [Streptomyces sp. tea 10]
MPIVSISSLKGGVGKSSVVLGLASAALEAHVPTLVVDLDPHGDASTALGVHARPGHEVGTVLRRPRTGALASVATASSWTKHPITPHTEPA